MDTAQPGHRFRKFAVVCGAATAVALLALTPRSASAADPVPKVTTELEISTTGTPLATSIVAIDVSPTLPVIRTLRAIDRDDERRYRRTVLSFLKGLRLFRPEQATEIVRTTPKLPKLEVGPRVAHLEFVAPIRLIAYEDRLGPWLILPRGTDLEFRIESKSGPLPVGWTVRATFDEGFEIDAAPGATDDGPRSVYWDFPKGAEPAAVYLRADPSERVENKLPSDSWQWYVRLATSHGARSIVPLTIIALIGIGALGSKDGPHAERTSWLRRVAITAVVLNLAQLAVLTLTSGWARSLIEIIYSEAPWYHSFTINDYGPVAIAALAIILVMPMLAGVTSKRAALISAGFALVVLASLALFTLSYWPPESAPALVPRSTTALNFLALATALGVASYVTFFGLRSIALFGSALVTPAFLNRLRPRAVWRRLRVWSPHARVPAFVVVVVLIVGYWLVDRYRQYEFFNDEFESTRFGDFLRFFPLEILPALSSLVWLLLLLALTALLASVGRSASSPILGPHRRVVWFVLPILFAGWVVGVSGRLWLIAAPVPFLIAVLVVLYLTRPRLESQESALHDLNADHEDSEASLASDDFRSEMLSRAREIAAIRRRRKSLYDDYKVGSLDELAYDKACTEVQNEETWLRRGGSESISSNPVGQSLLDRLKDAFFGAEAAPPPQPRYLARLPEGSSPYSFALSLGPRKSWWGNGVLAAGLAALAGLVPIAYFAYGYEWPGGGLAPLLAVLDLSGELARWVVAGLVFGCCYAYVSGRAGPVKALALLSMVVLTVAVVRLLPHADYSPRLASTVVLLALILAAIGIWMDWLSLRDRQIDAQHLADLYELHYVRKVAALTPVLVALGAATHQIASGDWQSVRDFFEGVLELIKTIA